MILKWKEKAMKIEIDFNKVEQDTLAEFIEALKNARPGCRIELREVYVLEVDDMKAASILQSLFGGNGHQEVEEDRGPRTEDRGQSKEDGTGRREAGKKSNRPHSPSLFTILTGPRAGEKIEGAALRQDLKHHRLEPGDRISHPQKGEKIIVRDTSDPAAPYGISAVGEEIQERKSKPEKKHRQDIRYEIKTGKHTGRLVTGGALGLMLKAGNLAPGTLLSHPTRGELTVVTNGQGTFTLQAVPA